MEVMAEIEGVAFDKLRQRPAIGGEDGLIEGAVAGAQFQEALVAGGGDDIWLLAGFGDEGGSEGRVVEEIVEIGEAQPELLLRSRFWVARNGLTFSSTMRKGNSYS